MRHRLPDFGPRGEGWVVAQFALIAVIAGLGFRDLQVHGPAHPWGPAATILGAAALVAGALVAALGAWELRASLSPFPRPVTGAALVESGVFRLIRHPIYSGLVLAAVGWAVLTGSVLALIAAGALFLVLDGKSRREEDWLASAHPGYGAYRARSKRLLPWFY